MISGKTLDWHNCRRKLLKADSLGFATRSPDDFSEHNNDENFCGSTSMLDFSRLSQDEQESTIYDEVNMIFSGTDTVNIRRQFNEQGVISWNINEKLSQTIRNQVRECLCLATHLYTARKHINAILNDGRRGTIAQSVAYVCSRILFKNVEKLCIELDDCPNKHISVITARVKPVESTAVDVGKILKFVDENHLIGGAVIGYLYEQKNYFLPSGFSQLLNKMISAAEEAYYILLFDWITTGSLIRDRAYEFMIWDLKRAKTLTVEDFTSGYSIERVKNYDTFEKRFVFISDLCPKTLEPVMDTIIKCGKYLYLYEQHVTKAKPRPLPLTLSNFKELAKRDLATVLTIIKDTCERSSMNLLKLLREKYDLDLFAKSLGQFFLDDGSDWLSNFIDYTVAKGIDVSEPANSRMMKTCFETALDNSLLKNNKFRSSFRLKRKEFNGIFQSIHGGFAQSDPESRALIRESMAFDVTLNPAFAIIFPDTIVERYNTFFHVLIHLKRTQVLLLRKRTGLVRTAFEEIALSNSMLRFVDKILQYVSEWVISGQLKTFQEAIGKATSIEQVVAVQDHCLNEATKKCSLDRECVAFVDVLLDIIMSYVTGDWCDFKEVAEAFSKNVDLCKEVVIEHESNLTPLSPLTYWLFGSLGSYSAH
uniref:Gamma-tubulin complex component n=1 Tax=Steinernema glaseri TaxID=37863 RepID=A0A1I8AUX9_9BILA